MDGRAVTQEQRGESELVTCYDLGTGEPLWTHENKARFSEAMGGDGPRANPTLHDGLVYAMGATGISGTASASSQIAASVPLLTQATIDDFEEGKATARFIEYEGKQVDAVRHYGRLADLICVPQPDGPSLGSNTLKTALFSSGRPVMMCPHADPMPASIGDHVAIAWNGSLEATRAVGMSMALIRAAKSVTILSTETIDHSASAEELHRYLELKSIASAVRTFEASGSNVGRALLAQCDEISADLMVMGAYHDSYERETIFGGNSQAVVEHANLPVVFVH